MSADLPPPLTPPDSDLRDFRFMPLDVVRFAQSDLVAFEDPAAIVAALLLWGASWHQRPAGSLTDDDRTLANLAGYGRAVGEWAKVKAGALRGFVKCSDGRLYHPVVAEKVRESWEGKLKQRHRTYCATIRQHNTRNPDDTRDAPTFEAWLDNGQPTTVKAAKRPPVQDELDLSRVTQADVTRDTPPESRATGGSLSRLSHAENRSKGQGRDSKGTGKGQGQGDSYIEPQTTDARKSSDDRSVEPEKDFLSDKPLLDLAQAICRVGAVTLMPTKPAAFAREIDIVKAWIKDGIDPEATILPTITRVLAGTSEDRIGSLKFYDTAVRKAHSKSAAAKATTIHGGKSAPPATLKSAKDDDDERVEQVRDRLLRDTGQTIYGQWFDPSKVALRFNGNGNRLVVTTAGSFHADWINEKLKGHLAAAAGTTDIEVRPE